LLRIKGHHKPPQVVGHRRARERFKLLLQMAELGFSPFSMQGYA